MHGNLIPLVVSPDVFEAALRRLKNSGAPVRLTKNEHGQDTLVLTDIALRSTVVKSQPYIRPKGYRL